MITLDAPAKVNLGLRILGRREDGYHDLETLFLAVGLFDTLSFEPMAGADFELTVDGADVGPVEDNLVLRAARLFREETASPIGGRFTLRKRIPAGAGLGGGSSDAGAALRLLDRVAPNGLGSEGLAAIGGRIGADVAFFALGKPFARGEGRGERLTPAPPPPARPLLLGVPPVHVATGPAYGALARRRAAADEGPPGGMLPAKTPGDWDRLERLLVNDFEPGVAADVPEVARLLEVMRAQVHGPVLLSGSGGAVFALPTIVDDFDADRIVGELERAAPECRFHAVTTLASLPEVREAGDP